MYSSPCDASQHIFAAYSTFAGKWYVPVFYDLMPIMADNVADFIGCMKEDIPRTTTAYSVSRFVDKESTRRKLELIRADYERGLFPFQLYFEDIESCVEGMNIHLVFDKELGSASAKAMYPRMSSMRDLRRFDNGVSWFIYFVATVVDEAWGNYWDYVESRWKKKKQWLSP